ncbi:MAG: polyphosphate kinase 2 family protein [Bacteriovoracaceae bacterium]
MHKQILPIKQHISAKKFFESKDSYDQRLKELQHKLISLQQKVRQKNLKVIILFEGPDAAGKGGVIKRLTEQLDPRGIQVHSIGKPTEEELKEFYMERFWRRLPKPGMISFFDRSWYGRVLVEPVEGLISAKQNKRSFQEINHFEKMLTDDGIIILKYFLDLSYDEQEIRFSERKNNPFKAWKLTSEDLRNRQKWNLYYVAFKKMLVETDTKNCPWTVVAGDSKWYARFFTMKDILKRIS